MRYILEQKKCKFVRYVKGKGQFTLYLNMILDASLIHSIVSSVKGDFNNIKMSESNTSEFATEKIVRVEIPARNVLVICIFQCSDKSEINAFSIGFHGYTVFPVNKKANKKLQYRAGAELSTLCYKFPVEHIDIMSACKFLYVVMNQYSDTFEHVLLDPTKVQKSKLWDNSNNDTVDIEGSSLE